MSAAKSITDEQRGQIQGWADAGADLPEIQRRLGTELGIKVTYMEVRFLMADLGIELKPAEEEEEEKPKMEDEAAASDADVESAGADDDDGAPEGVTVTISELQRPGAILSGRVTFAGGQTADWWVDQFGRLGLNPTDAEYKPSEDEMRAFQSELSRQARKRGF
ncbi:MAG: hypothetical protein KDM91_16900 [Verrucomicrobiae bacterium]|nr:hypothetical protein [Verrucomicrobiae bacterium]